MSDKFTGNWLVSEYVYNPDGSFAGIVQQKRQLETLANGKIRVIQHCTPSETLQNHPMQAFAGEWVFDLSIDGRRRLYHGSAVVGLGLAWNKEIITGEGYWTDFGHNFTSFGMLCTPERQITGGKFYSGSEMIANIIGVAIPETSDKQDQYPEFTGSHNPLETSDTWVGETLVFDADGKEIAQKDTTREFNANGWIDNVEDDTEPRIVQHERYDTRLRISGTAGGIAKRFGWLLDSASFEAPNRSMTSSLILDNHGENLLEFNYIKHDHVLTQVEIVKLKPVKE